mmetsp:Transcript_15840/g.25844  ORF Transcript_15840/g.25844 Transcript_15840/m.25844 type:complete len:178 (-) Transcript_15840:183-716(-)
MITRCCKLTRYMIIKLFEPFGTITRENFVWHTTGENRGAPRGYAFVEYRTKEACAKAQKAMDGKLCLGRRIAVRFAHQDDDNDKSMSDRNALKGKESSIMSTADKIRAIEEKLKRMQGKSKSKSAKDTSTSSEEKPQEEVKASKSVEDKDSIAADNVRSSSTRKIKTAKRNVRVKPY